MNGSTRRRLMDEDEDEDSGSPGKRATVAQPSTLQPYELDHYDIYALPSYSCPVPVPPPPHPQTHFKSASLVVVNRVCGLTTGLGIVFRLRSPDGLTLVVEKDPGFFLAREPSYDATRAVLLGWVQEEQLGAFELAVASVPVPAVGSAIGLAGGEAMQWLVEVLRRLEYEGYLANPELVCAGILDFR